MFSALIFLLVYIIEDKVLVNQIKAESKAYSDSGYISAWKPRNQNIQQYFLMSDLPDFIPKNLKEKIVLKEGVYEYFDDSRAMFIAHFSFKDSMGSYFLTYDVSDFITVRDTKKTLFFLISVVVVLIFLISTIFSRYLSKKILAPLRTLTNKLQNLEINEPTIDLAHQFYPDEIGVLTKELALALERVSESSKREFEFNQAVSHELRTPIQSAQSTLELLSLKDEQHKLHDKKYFDRLCRSISEMNQIVDAFLWLSSESQSNEIATKAKNNSQKNACSISVLTSIVEQFEKNKIKIEYDSDLCASRLCASHCYKVPEVVLQIIIRNLIRNAISHGSQESILIGFSERRISIKNKYISSADNSLGWGIGLTIIKRLCERFQCELIITDNQNSLFCVELTTL